MLSEFYDQIQWSTETAGLVFNHELGLWEINVTKPGILYIIINADGHSRSHCVNVIEKFLPKYTNITMFVDEKIPLEFEGELVDNFIRKEVSDPEIITFGDNLTVVAHKPGKAEVIIEGSIITIHVYEAKNLILQCNKTNLKTGDPVFVGSYVYIVPFIETDRGLLPPKTIEWKIDGNDNWEQLYDNSIIIKGEKGGNVIVNAIYINNNEKFEKTITIYFDHKLQLTNQDHINIPLGTTYNLNVVNNEMKKHVTYQIIPYSRSTTNNNVTIDQKGQIYAGSEGRYVIIVNYKSQWLTIPLTITKPSKLYLQSENTQIV